MELSQFVSIVDGYFILALYGQCIMYVTVIARDVNTIVHTCAVRIFAVQ